MITLPDLETGRRLVSVADLTAPSFGLVSTPPVFENYQKPASRNLFQDSFSSQPPDQVFGMDSVVLRKLNDAVNGESRSGCFWTVLHKPRSRNSGFRRPAAKP